MCVDCSVVGWPFPGNGRRVYALALVALELRLREYGVFQTRRGMIGASGLLHLVRESWNRNPKQWIQNKTVEISDSILFRGLSLATKPSPASEFEAGFQPIQCRGWDVSVTDPVTKLNSRSC